MSSLKTSKTLISILALLILGAGAYYFLQTSDVIPVDVIAGGETQPVGEDIILLVTKLNSVSIEASLFSTTLFTSLQDLSSVLLAEPQGRPNPFAPIGSDGTPVSRVIR